MLQIKAVQCATGARLFLLLQVSLEWRRAALCHDL